MDVFKHISRALGLIVLLTVVGLMGYMATVSAAPAPVSADSVVLLRTFGPDLDGGSPRDVAVDSHGNIYITRNGSKAAIVRMSPSGEALQTWYLPAPAEAGWDNEGAGNIGIDAQDNVYLGHTVHRSLATSRYVAKLNSSGTWLYTRRMTAGSDLDEIGVDASGNIYLIGNMWTFIDKYDTDMNIADGYYAMGSSICGITTQGDDVFYTKQSKIYKNNIEHKTGFSYNDLVIDGKGYFYGNMGGIVYQLSPSGDVVQYAQGFQSITGMAIDNSGRLFIVNQRDSSNGDVYVINPPPPSAAYSSISSSQSSVTVDGSLTISVTLKNYMGNPCIGRTVSLTGDSSSVAVTPVNGGISDSNGVATFTVCSTQAAPAVTFFSTDIATNLRLNEITVAFTHGAAKSLVWKTQPDNGIAGANLYTQPELCLIDQFGNQVTGDDSTAVTLTASNGAVLTGNVAVCQSGVAVFTQLQTTKSGSMKLTASTAAGISSAASNTITVDPAELAELVWKSQPPATGVQGQYLTAYPQVPEVYLYDRYSNFLKDDNSTRVQLITSNGQLLSNNTVTAVAGTATFSKLFTENTGSFTLTAVAYPGIESISGHRITVSENPAVLYIKDLIPGTKLSFAGYKWQVIDPSNGYLLMLEPLADYKGDLYDALLKPFGSITDASFDPSSSSSIAYYLNHDFLDSLPSSCRTLIQTHAWTTGINDGSNNQESGLSVLCKIGLISYSEQKAYTDCIDWSSYPWWTRTPNGGGFAWNVHYADLLGDYVFSEAAIRPALYLHPYTQMDGISIDFAAPPLMNFPSLTEVTAEGTTSITASTNTTGNTLAVKISSERVPEPSFGAEAPSGTGVTNPYISGSAVSAIAGDYVGVYELDSNQRVVAFSGEHVPTGFYGIMVRPMWVNIQAGGFQQLTATYIGTDKELVDPVWTSSDTSVAQVSSDGLITGMSEGYARITVTERYHLQKYIDVNVSAASTEPVTISSNAPYVPVYRDPLRIIVPSDINNAYLSTLAVSDGESATVTLPQIEAVCTTTQGNITILIPNNTVVTGPPSWDGTIYLPQFISGLTPPGGGEIKIAFEIGYGDVALNFSQPVRIGLTDQAKRFYTYPTNVVWNRNNVYNAIPYRGTDSDYDHAFAAGAPNGDGFITVGDDIVIWTTHFTNFVVYEPYHNTSSVMIFPSDYGEASGGGVYVLNSNISVSAVPYTGYNFDGWYIWGTNTKLTSALDYSFTVTADINLKPVFVAAHKITFNNEGALTTAYASIDGSVALPETPMRSGYRFGGWYTESSGNGALFNGSTTINSDIVVYAYWIKLTYDLLLTMESTEGEWSAQVTVTVPDAQIVQLVFAVYDGVRLVSTEIKNLNLIAAGQTTCTFKLPTGEYSNSNYTAKAFLFESIESIKPLCQSRKTAVLLK